MAANVQRTSDVEISENVPFSKMLLSDNVLAGLAKCGFVNPSPIQLRAIPIGCCGLDLLIKAKSGTGKTLVFCTLILEKYQPDIKMPQSLIVVPTREIAEQIKGYLNNIGVACPGFQAASFIGGRDIADDRRAISKCRAVVGTPGRLLHLISNNVLCMDHIKLFVLDEADKLLHDNFQNDVKKLMRKLPTDKVQILASSATFSDETNRILQSLMKNPIGVTPSRDTPILLGVKQCTYIMDDDEEWLTADKHTISIRAMTAKVDAMKDIFSRIAFKQAIIFSNSQMRAESYCKYLRLIGWKADVISGSHEQSVRLATFHRFRSFETRILVATDLMARGIDVENIDLVINLDVPGDSATYLHRIGRCGRFGSRGTAITIIGSERELVKFQQMLAQIGGDKLNVVSFRAAHQSLSLSNGNEVDVRSASTEATSTTSDDAADADEASAHDAAITANNDAEPENAVQTPATNGKRIKQYTRMPVDARTKNLQLLHLTRLMIDDDSANNLQVNLDTNLFESFNCQLPQTKSAAGLDRTNGNATRNGVQVDPDLFGSYKTAIAGRQYQIPNRTLEGLLASNEIIENSDDDDERHGDGAEIVSASVSDSESVSSSASNSDESPSSQASSSGSVSEESSHLHPIDMERKHSNETNVPFLEALKMLNITGANESSTTDRHQTVDETNKNKTRSSRRNRNSIHRSHQGTVYPMIPQYNQPPVANWSAIYWNQVNHIHQYVSFVRQQQSPHYYN